jgi:titin
VWYDSLIISTRRIPDPDVSAPNAPDLLRAVSTSPRSIDLTWRSNSYGTEQGFAIERCDDLANTCMATQSLFTQIATVLSGITSFHDDALISGKSYTYRVRAFGASGDYSAYSGGACFTGVNSCYSQDVAK